ncbi:MAG: amidohydrolase family protein [Candidatus Neomarinimicrobiota bacterium]|nr:amidohydrolase family protein [Candidatus Neomarinimicrobiota bacterium]
MIFLHWQSALFRSLSLVFSVSIFVLWDTTLQGANRYDVIIRNGNLLDGIGSNWLHGDLALHRGRIAAIGDLGSERGRQEIEAKGLIVAPGFIDTHSHAGPGLASKELSHGRPLLAQGITTVFVNPDGGGPTNLTTQRRALRKHGLGVNVAQFISHGSARRKVVGATSKNPTPMEQKAMGRIVRRAMRAGAWGLSSGTFYAPGNYAKPEEIIDLASITSEFGGVYQSHIRDESNYSVGLLAAVEEVIEVGRQAHLPVVITHIKALGPPVWGQSEEIIARIQIARKEGIKVYADQYPYTASATGLAAALVPRWAQAGGNDSLLARLENPAQKDRIKMAMMENLARRGGPKRIQFRRVNFDPRLEGQRLHEVARAWSLSPIEAALKLLVKGYVGIVSFNMKGEDIREFMRQPWTMTASDGGLVPWMEGVPHPRSYGAFSKKIERYVIKETVLDLPMAIRSMTSLPAEVYGMTDRGVLREGAVADILIFNPEKIRTTATYTSPHQLSEGMVHVFVNGAAAVRYGEFTNVMSGKILRKK